MPFLLQKKISSASSFFIPLFPTQIERKVMVDSWVLLFKLGHNTYSVSVLLNHHFRQSWCAFEQHWPNFPRMHHYNGALVDLVNALYLSLLGKLKYSGWLNNEGITVHQSPFGIIPMLDEPSLPRGAPSKHLKPGWRYVSWAMEYVLPCTPVVTKDERILFKQLVKELFAERWSLFSDDFFLKMCKRWNETHVIMPPRSKPNSKLLYFPIVGHLVKHYKAWSVNQRKRVAMKVASDSVMARALRHNTGVTVPSNFEAQGIPVEPPQSESVLQCASLAKQEAAKNTDALHIPPPVMHLAPYP
jgi:hypothetical protein